MRVRNLRCAALLSACWLAAAGGGAERNNAYFGDLHIHSRYSYDAFFFGTKGSPDDAYEFAKGGPLTVPSGEVIRLDRPLDFYAVTDHYFFLGQWWASANDPNHPYKHDAAVQEIIKTRNFRGAFLFPHDRVLEADIKTAWQDIQGAAARHNDPGTFTTFVGFEFTPEKNMDGQHRVVIFEGDRVPELLIGRIETLNPEDLWDWQDKHRADGIESLAIPHNTNLSGGRMFENTYFDGSPIDAAYAERRMRNEPLVEITQMKGTSDTHPFLSPNDEWADFEIRPFKLGPRARSNPSGSYVRDALRRGITLAEQLGINPYRYGIVGASDTHAAGQTYTEENFTVQQGGRVAAQRLGSVPVDEAGVGYRETSSRYHSAAGLTGVWAAENSRKAIYAALRRRETFGTTGPRIKVRLAGGFDEMVPQGHEVEASGKGQPRFEAWALADPAGAKLQRLQVIKGWVEDGDTHERVLDVACSDGLKVDARTQRCPDNGASVDTTTCKFDQGIGDGQLKAAWMDADYTPGQRAFYYVRALENPTCRWSTWDAIRAGTSPRPDLPLTIQERAWTSPIWVTPSG
ncbi:MAG: DUF3604 domain-containing protein [Gammaproteobacteria bacterium]|nr:DUF3604 domain-containing protein [Gammaproteobacteria bacterium]